MLLLYKRVVQRTRRSKVGRVPVLVPAVALDWGEVALRVGDSLTVGIIELDCGRFEEVSRVLCLLGPDDDGRDARNIEDVPHRDGREGHMMLPAYDHEGDEEVQECVPAACELDVGNVTNYSPAASIKRLYCFISSVN